MNIMENEDVPKYHIWNFKTALCEFIVPRLKLSIEKAENNEFMAISIWVKPEFGRCICDENELNKIWIDILKDILFSFDYQLNISHYQSFSIEEIDFKRKRGLELFAKYFDHLWDYLFISISILLSRRNQSWIDLSDMVKLVWYKQFKLQCIFYAISVTQLPVCFSVTRKAFSLTVTFVLLPTSSPLPSPMNVYV